MRHEDSRPKPPNFKKFKALLMGLSTTLLIRILSISPKQTHRPNNHRERNAPRLPAQNLDYTHN